MKSVYMQMEDHAANLLLTVEIRPVCTGKR
jgi:hypothetical protein